MLAGPEVARDSAVEAVGELMRDADGKFWNRPAWRMIVTDEQGVMICEIRVSGTASSG